MLYRWDVEFKLNFPCYFTDLDSIEDLLGDYLESYINDLQLRVDLSDRSIDFSGACSVDIYDNDASVSVGFDIDCPEYGEEEVDQFISDNYSLLNQFIEQLQNEISTALAGHDVFGYLPEGEYVDYRDDSLYLRLYYHQSTVNLDLKPVSAEFEDDINYILEDAYYNPQR
jgi:hypothetical protein